MQRKYRITNIEIEYAKKLGKEIIYFTDLMKNNYSDKLKKKKKIDKIKLTK